MTMSGEPATASATSAPPASRPRPATCHSAYSRAAVEAANTHHAATVAAAASGAPPVARASREPGSPRLSGPSRQSSSQCASAKSFGPRRARAVVAANVQPSSRPRSRRWWRANADKRAPRRKTPAKEATAGK
ncbi:hypothetical protein FJ250_11210 [bacterium]|nr:hypothetical protein [bacterium]